MTTNKDSSQKGDQNNISIQDAIRWQDSLKKDIDFDKPDSELKPEQLVNKMVYLAMDEAVEKSIGKDVKKDLDEKRIQMESLSFFQTNLNKLTELGKEIEKGFLWQNAYLVNHFDKSKENHYFVVTRGMTDDAVNNKSLSNSERVDLAKKILDITKAYREKIVKELIAKQEITSALLLAFEKNFKVTDFGLFTKEIGDETNTEQMRSQFQEWLTLSKELSGYRKKGIDAVDEDIDLDEILPRYIIENKGDMTKNLSGIEMKTKGERVVRLIGEADNAEKDIGEKRSIISEWLFGKAESYMDFLKENEQKETPTNQSGGMSKKTKWFIVIALSIVALSWGIWTAIGVFILGMIMINVLSNK